MNKRKRNPWLVTLVSTLCWGLFTNTQADIVCTDSQDDYYYYLPDDRPVPPEIFTIVEIPSGLCIYGRIIAVHGIDPDPWDPPDVIFTNYGAIVLGHRFLGTNTYILNFGYMLFAGVVPEGTIYNQSTGSLGSGIYSLTGAWGSVDTRIINDGQINVGAEPFPSIWTPGPKGIYVEDNSDATNNGAISVQSDDLASGIEALGDAIVVSNSLTGTISIAGADAAGIWAESFGGSGNTVTNDGFISVSGANSSGIAMFGQGTLMNTGTIDVVGTGSEGIHVLADNLPEAITNSGTIHASGSDAEGMGVWGENLTVLNTSVGHIETLGDGSVGIAATGQSISITNDGDVTTNGLTSEGISVTGDTVDITNSSTGSVNVMGDSSVGMGIYGHGDMFNDNTVTVTGSDSAGMYLAGTGTITNSGYSGSVAIYGAGSGAIGGDSTGNIDVVNLGTVYAFGSDSAGIFLRGEGSGTGVVTNKGDVLVEGVTGFGIGVMADNATVTNSATGSITVTDGGSTGMGVAGNYAKMTNEGTITATSSSSIGMRLLGNDSILMQNKGTIATAGVDGYGMVAEGLNPKMLNGGTITTLEDGAYGMLLVSSALSGAQLLNEGAINTSGDGADAIHGQTFGGIFNNQGDISTIGSGATGIFVVGSGNSVMNSALLGNGTIKTTGLASSGIQATGDTVTVINHATIETQAPYSHGINVTGDNAIVSNTQSIKTTGNFSNGIEVSGNAAHIENSKDILSAGHGINVTGNGVAGVRNIWNYGTIITTGPAASGVRLIGNALYFTNVSEGVDARGAGGTGIYAEGDGIVVDNASTIRATGLAPFAGVQMNTLASQASQLINSGEILSGEILCTTCSAVLGGAGRDFVINSHDIYGNIDLKDGNDALFLLDGSFISGVSYGGANDATVLDVSTGNGFYQYMGDLLDVIVNGTLGMTGDRFIGFEELIKTGPGTARVSGTMSIGDEIIVDEGILELAPGSILNALGIVNYGVLKGYGTVDGNLSQSGGASAPGTSIGQLSITGDFLMTGGALEMEANSLFDTDKLSIGGNAVLSGGYLDVILGYEPDVTDVLEFLLVQGTLELSDGFGGVRGFAAAGSGVPVGTQFTVNLGGQLFTGTVASVVPVPPSVWLFASGLLGLIAVSRRKWRS